MVKFFESFIGIIELVNFFVVGRVLVLKKKICVFRAGVFVVV